MSVTLRAAVTAEHLFAVGTLFREYADSLGVDLEYQSFGEELRGLPGDYAPPSGMLLIACDGEDALGCVGVRSLGDGVAEMKRLYVRPVARGTGLGRTLAERAIEFSLHAGYQCIRLDTLPHMQRAQELYRQLGFVTIDPYRYSAVPGTVFMEKALGRNK